ncbi:diamine acetyltransferase 2-like isoform X2 [Pecten maximus]|uniref:diamine acetyltransferase 2-like isoform X2 n=1 Tax=Pecten maximus TaxID=6579 RepID=UPI001457F6FE|nr:diamine acetyltransferase 2-like isoform X2 [Pecten maximus]
MSGFTIRRAVDEDIEEIFRMCMELADLSDDGDSVKTTPENSASQPLIGYALYVYTFSTWDGRSAFLNDIYVTPDHRGKGIGTDLLRTVAQDVLDNGCVLMEWCVLNWNSNAIEFYKSKGAFDLTEAEHVHIYKMPKSSLEKLAK